MTGYEKSPDYGSDPSGWRWIIVIALAWVIIGAGVIYARAMPECGSGQRINCVVDGDTVWIDGEKIRLLNVDAPEIGQADCRAERQRGIAARDRMVALTKGRPEIIRDGKDRYGRTLAKVRFGGRDVGEALIATGHARRWTGQKSDWCQ